MVETLFRYQAGSVALAVLCLLKGRLLGQGGSEEVCFDENLLLFWLDEPFGCDFFIWGRAAL